METAWAREHGKVSSVQLTFPASSDGLIALLQKKIAEDSISAVCFTARNGGCTVLSNQPSTMLTRISFNVIESVLFVSTLRGRSLHVQTHAGWHGRQGAVIEVIIVLKAPSSAFNKEQQTQMFRLERDDDQHHHGIGVEH